MTAEDDDVQAVVDAVLAKDVWRVQRDQHIWDLMHVHGWKVPRITATLAVALDQAGVPASEQRGLGVSHDNIRRVTEGARP